MAGTPKAVVHAAFPPTIRAGDAEIQPLTILSYLALEAVQSPLVASGHPAITLQDMCTAVSLLRLDTDTLSALVSRYLVGGTDGAAAAAEIRQASMRVAATIPLADLASFTHALTQQIQRGFDTAVGMRGADESPLARPKKASPAGAGRSS